MNPSRRNRTFDFASAFLVAMLISACGHIPLRKHAQIAEYSAHAIELAATAIEQAAAIAEQATVDASDNPDGAVEAIDLVRARFKLIENAYETLQTAHKYYVSAIVRAQIDGRTLDIKAPGELLAAWLALTDVASGLNIPIREPPPELLRVVGMGR